jgi:hypothetical protein
MSNQRPRCINVYGGNVKPLFPDKVQVRRRLKKPETDKEKHARMMKEFEQELRESYPEREMRLERLRFRDYMIFCEQQYLAYWKHRRRRTADEAIKAFFAPIRRG